MSIFSPADGVLPAAGARRPTRVGPHVRRRSRFTLLDKLLTSAPAAKAQGNQWKRAYHRRVLIVDTLVITAALAIAQVLRFTFSPAADPTELIGWHQVTALAVVLATTWLVALELQQSRDLSLVGVGEAEYRRVFAATMWVFGSIAVIGLLFKIPMSRLFLMFALVIGLPALVMARHFVRRDLARRRKNGQYITRVVVLGRPDSVDVLCESLRRSSATGHRVVGVCVPNFDGEVGDELDTPVGRVPILGDDSCVENALDLTGADALAVAAVEHLGHKRMKKLIWRLEALGTDLIVVPGVTDIAGPRLRMTPIDNLPLFQIAPPRQDGPSAVAKRAFDLGFATIALLAALPILAIAAVAIKLDDNGPVLFRQERVGFRGNRFRIIKLRTMLHDAEARKDAEVAAAADGGVFFKSACDSRVTRVGRFLRASSIDELPQLLNVLGGSMSVVGPRPLVPGEGESVEDFIERRKLVKPGMTGLWQISGRSDLSEDERIRLDHSYVDNWSCVMDLIIVWRTVRAVLKRDGAY